MIAGISVIRDRITERRGCYHSKRRDGLLRAKELGTGKWFYVHPKNAVWELRPRTLANKRKTMSQGTESVRNRHRPGIQTIDTRVYGGPTRVGPMRKKTPNDVLEKARQHKAKQSGRKFVDGLPREEVL